MNCERCGKELVPNAKGFLDPNRRFCNDTCKNRAACKRSRERQKALIRAKIRKNCERCGKEFIPNHYGFIDPRKQFCSVYCEEAARRKRKQEQAKVVALATHIPKYCEICGKELPPTKQGYFYPTKRFCSKKCKNVAAGQRRQQREALTRPDDGLPATKICPQCGATIVRPPGYASNWWRKKTFCNIPCHHKYYRKVNAARLNECARIRNQDEHRLALKRQHGSAYARKLRLTKPETIPILNAASLANYYKNRDRILAQKEGERRAAGVTPHGEAQSRPVKEIAAFYRAAFPGCEILLDHPVLVNPETGFFLRFDIWIPSQCLAIEADGPIHREPIFGQDKLLKTQRLDALKDRLADEANITLIRIPVD